MASRCMWLRVSNNALIHDSSTDVNLGTVMLIISCSYYHVNNVPCMLCYQ
jgi:hypothetical protein